MIMRKNKFAANRGTERKHMAEMLLRKGLANTAFRL